VENLEPRIILIAGALIVGALYGATARLSGFCLRSALIEVVEGRPWRQARAWAIATFVAVLGTQILANQEMIDLGNSIYLGSTLLWGGAIIGGLMFGFGMMLTRGCGGRHLVLAAGGNLRSWMVLVVMGLVAYMTLRGILAVPRLAIEGLSSGDLESGGFSEMDMVSMIADTTGLAEGALRWGLLVLLGVGVAAVTLRGLKPGDYRHIVAGLFIGLLIPVGWYLSGVVGFDDFEPTPLVSLTFITPVANSIQYLMTFTGTSADFGIAMVGGALAGAIAAATLSRDLTLEGFDGAPHMARYGLGAALMGAGGVMAMGCTIGQGLTGISTLSLGSLIAFASIVTGGRLGLGFIRRRQLAHGVPQVPSPAE